MGGVVEVPRGAATPPVTHSAVAPRAVLFPRQSGDAPYSATRRLRDTQQAMSEESATPDLVELTQELSDARGVDATMQFYAAEAVYDMSKVGLGTFVGRPAIRRFLEEWLGSYEETEDAVQEITDLGN